MKRIRYSLVDGCLISIPVLIKDATFQGTISPGFDVAIMNNKSEEVLLTQGKNLAHCKRIVKHELKRLGANFLDEIRHKKETLDNG